MFLQCLNVVLSTGPPPPTMADESDKKKLPWQVTVKPKTAIFARITHILREGEREMSYAFVSAENFIPPEERLFTKEGIEELQQEGVIVTIVEG